MNNCLELFIFEHSLKVILLELSGLSSRSLLLVLIVDIFLYLVYLKLLRRQLICTAGLLFLVETALLFIVKYFLFLGTHIYARTWYYLFFGLCFLRLLVGSTLVGVVVATGRHATFSSALFSATCKRVGFAQAFLRSLCLSYCSLTFVHYRYTLFWTFVTTIILNYLDRRRLRLHITTHLLLWLALALQDGV